MASSASANTANTGSGQKRTAASSGIQHDHDLQPPAKKKKRQTKLDTLKADQKSEAVELKKSIELILELVQGKDVANEAVLKIYVVTCDQILAGKELGEAFLRALETPFKDHFQPDDVLLKNLGLSVLIFLNTLICVINELLPKLAKLTEAILVEVRGLPEPSSYARHLTWRVWQDKETAILNLRPPTNQGLPIEILHPAFASFVDGVKSIPRDEWAPEDEINKASLALCKAMARSFTSETDRRAELAKQLGFLGSELQVEFHIAKTLPLETHSARPDLRFVFQNTTVLLGEVKAEFETGDPYMQVSRSYQALVHRLESESRASDGVPCILLVVCGTLLTVAAGFSDGQHITVEPLSNSCTMLPSRYHWREQQLAHVLFFTKKAMQMLSQPSTARSSPPGTPRIYPSYFSVLQQCTCDLEFISLLGDGSINSRQNLLFLARDPAIPASTLLVKLVDPKHYSEEVHQALADAGLAPLLQGTVRVAGAPSAIIMEYLDPEDGWETLQEYIKAHREIKVDTDHPALAKLLRTMKEKKVVHGDLRPNNIMCRAQPGGTEGQGLEIKVVDFDWAGKLGSTKYPAIMNQAIKWPGAPCDLIGEDDDGALLAGTLAMV